MTTTTIARPTKPAAIGGTLEGPAVYIACLAAYNSGTLHGYWVDLEEASTVEDIRECIAYTLATSPALGAEEYAVHDHQGLPACLQSEWPDWQQVEAFMEARDALHESEQVAHLLACNINHRVLDVQEFSESFCGFWERPEDFAQEQAEQAADPEVDWGQWPINCIDWQSAWRDLSCDGYHAEFVADEGYAVFAP
jgi:antirestriction protein